MLSGMVRFETLCCLKHSNDSSRQFLILALMQNPLLFCTAIRKYTMLNQLHYQKRMFNNIKLVIDAYKKRFFTILVFEASFHER